MSSGLQYHVAWYTNTNISKIYTVYIFRSGMPSHILSLCSAGDGYNILEQPAALLPFRCSSELLISIHHPKQCYNPVPTITEAWIAQSVIATRYRLDCLGIESRWGRYFPHPSRPTLGPTQPPIQWVPGLFRGVRQLGHGVDHPHPSSTKVEGRVELYICSPSGSLWPVLG